MSSSWDLLVDCDMLRKEEGKVAADAQPSVAFCGVYETSWTADVGVVADAEEPKSPSDSPELVALAESLCAVGIGLIGDDFGGKGGYLNEKHAWSLSFFAPICEGSVRNCERITIGANARVLSLPLKDLLFDKPSALGLFSGNEGNSFSDAALVSGFELRSTWIDDLAKSFPAALEGSDWATRCPNTSSLREEVLSAWEPTPISNEAGFQVRSSPVAFRKRRYALCFPPLVE